MTAYDNKYEGYSLQRILLEAAGDAAKMQFLRLWTVAMASPSYDVERAIEAAREGMRKTKQAYEGACKMIKEEVPE